MDKNSVIGLILIAGILFGFTFYQNKQAQKLQAARIAAGDAVEYVVTEPAPVAQTPQPVAEAKPTFFKDDALNAAYNSTSEVETLENDKVVIEFSTKGGQPLSVKVKDFYCYDSTELYIFKPGCSEYNVSVFAGQYISTKDLNFTVAEKTDSTIIMRLAFTGGGYIEQKYILPAGSYSLDNELSFVGMDGIIPKNVTSLDVDFEMTIPRMEKGYKNELQYSKLNYYFDGEKKPVEIGRGKSASKRVESKLSWFAFQQQFFSAIIRAPKEFASGALTVNFFPQEDPERRLMACSAKMRNDFRPAEKVTIPFEFYFGPNDYTILSSYDQKYEKIIPLGGWLVGWFTRFAIIPMFNFFNRFISSFGLIILLMTIVIKIVVLPLTYKSLASSAKMQALKPEIDKINERYPKQTQEEQMKKQQATMNLYKRAGVSPLGGCLPTLLTFPILWAMFRFFPASIELRQQSFLWCHDLSSYDSIVDFGVRVPLIGDHLSLFALLMAVTMWVYSKMTMSSQPGGNDPSAASMKFMTLWMMPIMMFFICNNLSAALSYYYLLSQLIAMLQTWIIRRSIDKNEILERVRATEGKPIPKSKFQLRLEEAQRMQQQQLKAQKRK